MTTTQKNQALTPKSYARLVLADGTVFAGQGLGAKGESLGELCFNTAMTGQQEILADPSYAGQIVCFTFPHVGNVGTNEEDEEAISAPARAAATGMVMRADMTAPANYRSTAAFDTWMAQRGIIGISGVDTRAITRRIRENGMPMAVIAHSDKDEFDIEALIARAREANSMEGQELAEAVMSTSGSDWKEGDWIWNEGHETGPADGPLVVVLDYGVKANILRRLVSAGARVKVAPGKSSATDILSMKPDGVVVSNGPGDPAATGQYALDTIRGVIDAGVPTLGICLGHQMLALALGGKTLKMAQGHHGANHPVKNHETGQVEIVSMNHGFAVDASSLPADAVETHVSLFDGSNCGFRLTNRPVMSVQHHPEASPGPQDSFAVFDRFVASLSKETA
ncbi:glutamine-hydrolyzing carbamoyl-phosphate synthase small subunit [Hyphobacterium sp. HN65]|uniref:Carbamoyl phosphate synthase small chain n=1 Tax=Hyphobacterium lacteum TaxID=3116575 RepID=A0ABU7LR56_9PROT|nr:glutamine-hydrolyzing carbamoyl-phosphate synthase small subunit [Hyphobacterium sp. HN65]MEE2526391.1 glutamine-hydrolyzing carbamoyl-phosphate synthase small subunit [Hyphobacterium sp. HN65]